MALVPLTYSLSGLHLLVSLCKFFRYMLYVCLYKGTKVKVVCACKSVHTNILKIFYGFPFRKTK